MMIVLISWLPVIHKWTAAFGLTSMRKRTMLVSFPAVGHCHHIERQEKRMTRPCAGMVQVRLFAARGGGWLVVLVPGHAWSGYVDADKSSSTYWNSSSRA